MHVSGGIHKSVEQACIGVAVADAENVFDGLFGDR